jgi:hypothetical protein
MRVKTPADAAWSVIVIVGNSGLMGPATMGSSLHRQSPMISPKTGGKATVPAPHILSLGIR